MTNDDWGNDIPAPEVLQAKGAKLEKAASLIIEALGEEAGREGLLETPRRFREMFLADFSVNGSPEKALEEMIIKEETFDQMILVRNVPIHGHCEHHLLPWAGLAGIAYIPNDNTVGLSKITRLVEAASRGLTIQERVTEKIASALVSVLEPQGVQVVVEARHMCTLMRGVRAERQTMTTSIAKGVFRDNPETRMEFLTLWSRTDPAL